jgi:hypothetical protein
MTGTLFSTFYCIFWNAGEADGPSLFFLLSISDLTIFLS